jgi:hypothetical protein
MLDDLLELSDESQSDLEVSPNVSKSAIVPEEMSKEIIKCPPQLCVSFLISVADKGSTNELLDFDEADAKVCSGLCVFLLNSAITQKGIKRVPSCLEIFCDGLQVGPDPDNAFMGGIPGAVKKIAGFQWRLVEERVNPLKELRIVSATTFRHRYVELDPKKWVFDRQRCLERCWFLQNVEMPFPKGLVELNLDYLANFLMLGLVIPETLGYDLSHAVENRELCSYAVRLSEKDMKKSIKPLKLRKAVRPYHVVHHLSNIGWERFPLLLLLQTRKVVWEK